MGRIFISYSRRDTEVVDRVVEAICAAGLEVWIDRQAIEAGNSWRVQIVQAIDTCDAFVLMLSPNSAASDNVRKEIDLAQDSGRAIFALMLEPVKLPAQIRYQLAGLQFIDVRMLGLDQAVSQLTGILKKHVASLKPSEEPKARQAEVVIKGVDLQSFTADMQEQLLNFVAQLAHANRSGLAIAGMAAGSLHVFIDMPVCPAYELKTLALNRDKRFRKFRITSLRLAGDAKFVNISLGILTAAATIGFLQTLWLSTPPLLLPVVGATAGKVLTISLAVGVTAGLAFTAPRVIAPRLPPPSTLEPSLIPASTEAPTSPPAPTEASTETSAPVVPSAIPSISIITPLASGTPQLPIVVRDTLCWLGPGPDYEAVQALKKDTLVELMGCATIDGWWIIESPIYHSGCWIMEDDLQIGPNTDTQNLSCLYPPPKPTPKPRPQTRTAPIPPACTPDLVSDPACFCKLNPGSTWCHYYYYTPTP